LPFSSHILRDIFKDKNVKELEREGSTVDFLRKLASNPNVSGRVWLIVLYRLESLEMRKIWREDKKCKFATLTNEE